MSECQHGEAAMSTEKALEMAGRSDTGCVRAHNEDAIHFSAARGLAILADGMGGHNAGEVASGMVTVLLGSELDKVLARKLFGLCMDEAGEARMTKLLKEEIARANGAVYQAARSQPQYAGMGTTLVMAVFIDNALMAAHVGDSRLYRLRHEQLDCLTRDHSLLQERLDSGLMTPEEARLSTQKNFITRAIGAEPEVQTEIHRHEVQVGDVYLLCSDGLNDMVKDEDIRSTLAAWREAPGQAVDLLIDLAKEQGGKDNVSALVICVRSAFPAAGKGWLRRWLA